MKKLFCDICGKEIIVRPISIQDIKECDYTVFRNDKYGRNPLDLCEDCSNNLEKLILKEGNNE